MAWTVDQLQEFFHRRGIPSECYCFYGKQEDSICIEREGDDWVVFYVEQGKSEVLAYGRTEHQALDVMKLYVLEATKQL